MVGSKQAGDGASGLKFSSTYGGGRPASVGELERFTFPSIQWPVMSLAQKTVPGELWAAIG